MAELVNILLQRCDSTIPWGFGVQGKNQNGCGYLLYVDKVTPNTIASNYLKPGDIILSLSKNHANDLANKNIAHVIKQAGNSLELIIAKKPTTNSSPTPYPGPNSPPTPSFGNLNAFAPPPPPSFGNLNSFAPPPPPRNPANLSPRSPGNASPQPQKFPSPPPMPGSGQGVVMDVPQPPPPPPPMPTGQSSAPWRSKQAPPHQEQQQQHQQHQTPNAIKANQHPRASQGPVNQYDNLPAALQSTLSKDKKPFTYTPGGIDLSELRSPKMQRRLHYNQMDPPRNLAKVPAPETTEARSVSTPPPPETYPQPRVQLLPTVQGKMPPPPKHMSNKNQPNRESSPKTQQQPRTQAYVHSNYNSPMNLYSPDNAAEAFNAQTGESLPGFENLHMNKQGTESPRYEDEANFTPYYKGQFPQSRSFRLLQVMTDTTSPNAEEDQDKMMTNREEDEMKFSGFNRNPIPSRAFQTLQKITGDDEETSPPAQYQPVNPANISGTENCELRYRGAYIPSRSFKLLQEMTGGSDEEVNATRNRTPKKTTVNIQVGNGSQPYNNQQPQYEKQGPNQHTQWIPPSEQPAEAEPKKYMGGHIPSRSFRILQAMTGGDDDATDSIEIPVQHEANHKQQESEPRMYMGANIPSRSFRILQQMTDESQ